MLVIVAILNKASSIRIPGKAELTKIQEVIKNVINKYMSYDLINLNWLNYRFHSTVFITMFRMTRLETKNHKK